MMLCFGSRFDTDPQLPWAKETLNDPYPPDQMARAERLHGQAVEYLEAVAGPDDAYGLKALRELTAFARSPLPVSERNFAGDMLLQLHRLYPQKCSQVGEHGLRALIDGGAREASTHQFPTPRGPALFVLLMFALGHGVAADPLFPWISRTLHDPDIIDPASRAKRLEAKMLVYLDAVLARAGASSDA
jgi:hypothetical protein